ncbi:MAG: hypothetical protein R3D71_10005 [Rickettsiales bacterium]
MIPRKNLILIAVLLCLYGVYKLIYPTGSFNYRVTIAVDTPEGVKIGSAVRKVTASDAPRISPHAIGSVSVKGEAVVIDLGERGVLFALLRSETSVDYGYRIAFNNFVPNGALTGEVIRRYSSLRGKKELAFDKLPMLVRFRDINDPKTVELVDPNDLAASFGEGVKLKSASIEITDDAVTTGVEKYLPSFGKETGYLEWFRSLPYGDSRKIGPYDFKKGTKK